MTQNCISLQVLAASDADAEEERVGNEINRSSSQVRCKGVAKGEVKRVLNPILSDAKHHIFVRR